MVNAAQNAPPTRVKPTQLLQITLGCQQELIRVTSAVEKGLKSLRAQRAAAYLGVFGELKDLLIEAGNSHNKALAAASSVDELLHQSTLNRELAYLNHVIQDLVAGNFILPCVVSSRCSIAEMRQNHIVFTGVGKEAVQIVMPSVDDADRFAINFTAAYANLAGERKLLAWLRAGTIIGNTRPGSVDVFHRHYVGHGTGAHREHDVDQGFAICFMTTYFTLQAQALFARYFPADAAANAAHLNASTYQQLTAGPLAYLTAPVAARLRFTETNLLVRAQEILDVINQTIDLSEQ